LKKREIGEHNTYEEVDKRKRRKREMLGEDQRSSLFDGSKGEEEEKSRDIDFRPF